MRSVKRLLGLIQLRLCAFDSRLEQGRLLLKRLKLHVGLPKQPFRIRDLPPVPVGKRPVLGDALRIDGYHLLSPTVAGLCRCGFRSQRAQTLLCGMDILMKLASHLFGIGDGPKRLLYERIRLHALRSVQLKGQVKRADLVPRHVDVETAHLVAKLLVLLRLADLPLQGADLSLHLAQDIRLAKQVLLRLLYLADRLLAVCLELRYAGGLLEHGATVFGLRGQDLVYLALRHYRIRGGAYAGAHEQALHVLEAAPHLVYEILAAAVPVYATSDGHLVVLRAELLLAVREHDGHFAQAERLARVRAVEHHVGKLCAAQSRRTLLAEHPADCVGHV